MVLNNQTHNGRWPLLIKASQVVAAMVLAFVTISSSLLISSASDLSASTRVISERVTAIEANRFTHSDGAVLTREVDRKIGREEFQEAVLRISDKLDAIHTIVTTLQAKSAMSSTGDR